MAIKIITDSASDILPAEAQALGITVIPMIVRFGDTEYQDSVTMTHSEFYDRLAASKQLPTTSQIIPSVFEEKYEEITANGDTALVITMSSLLSGTYQSACIAATEYEGKVYVVDSMNVTVGERLLISEALRMISEDTSVTDIVAALDQMKSKIRLLALLDTLEYLKKGGRISAAAAIAGEMLSIKPVIEIEQGIVAMKGKARGSKKANNLLREMISAGNGVDFTKPYFLAYSGNSDELLQNYITDCGDLWKEHAQILPICSVGSTIGTHAGPGAIAIAYYEK